jgi:hypothetical protein
MSASFTPSDLQAKAIREIKDWFLHRTAEQQVFRVFGYAGTGKTTLTRHAIDERRLDTMVKGADGMVGDEMARDLLAFGKPILVLGDPGQLPPIKGDGAFTRAAPDVMLTEIHRQAGESAIIRLAAMARRSLPINTHARRSSGSR